MAGNGSNETRQPRAQRARQLVESARSAAAERVARGASMLRRNSRHTGETEALGAIGPTRSAGTGLSAALARAWRDPATRQWIVIGGAALALVLLLVVVVPAGRRAAAPSPAPEVTQPDAAPQPAPAEGQPPAEAPPAEAPPAEAPPAEAPPAEAPPAGATTASPVRRVLFDALPLLLGLFWLLSAWLVDAEARRAFVVQEPWGERRTVAYTALAVGCVFPLILAGLIFSAWGFVTFVLGVARRESPLAGIQAGAAILVVCATFLVLRGAVARWMDSRRVRRP